MIQVKSIEKKVNDQFHFCILDSLIILSFGNDQFSLQLSKYTNYLVLPLNLELNCRYAYIVVWIKLIIFIQELN